MYDPKTNSVATAEVGSNIALIKYWGKRDPERQWPANDSLSMTLSTARTVTEAWIKDGTPAADLDGDELHWAGRVLTAAQTPEHKALRHLQYLRTHLGFAAPLHVESRNTFPSDCGIASSASGLAALTLAAVAAWTGAATLAELADLGFGRERLADLARLGSGSACRSFFGGVVRWQAGPSASEQRTQQLVDEHYWRLADVIVIISNAPKAISSTAAHAAAWSSLLFEPRLAVLPARLAAVETAIKRRDLERLGELIEVEALDMHAVMMTAQPPSCFINRDTANFLAWLRHERRRSGLQAYFTLDAGANVHVICEASTAARVGERIREAYPQYELIMDAMGHGPRLSRRSLT